MTNEEKFRAGTVVYKDDDGDYVCELWEASTRHPDVVYHMNADGEYKKSGLRSSFLSFQVGRRPAREYFCLLIMAGPTTGEEARASKFFHLWQFFPPIPPFTSQSALSQNWRYMAPRAM